MPKCTYGIHCFEIRTTMKAINKMQSVLVPILYGDRHGNEWEQVNPPVCIFEENHYEKSSLKLSKLFLVVLIGLGLLQMFQQHKNSSIVEPKGH
jgi:hypothetical protein